MDLVDLTPPPEKYRRLLQMIIRCSSSPEDRKWAAAEYQRIADVVVWKR